MKGGLRALFKGSQLKGIFDEFQDRVDSDVLQAYQFAGEEFVGKARLIDTYRDKTGNLRASIGYIILLDGKVVDSNFEGKAKGMAQGLKVSKGVSLDYPDGYVLIGVAGMDYAASVENNNYDVITGSADGLSDLLKSILNEI